jgi:ComF family protein
MEALHKPGLGKALRRVQSFAADMLLPPACASCRSAIGDNHALCPACWSRMRFIEPPLCPVYGTPFTYQMGDGILSAEALANPPPFRQARAAAVYGDIASRLVHQVKYHDRPDLAITMARAMHRAGRSLLPECALIVPVPLYRWRLWRRRFNQSAVLALHLSAFTGRPHDPFVLERVKPTRSQVGLTAVQRAENVRGAFRVPESMRGRIARQSVLLVDDVYTSGATVKAATRALLRGGAGSVDVLTFARVMP